MHIYHPANTAQESSVSEESNNNNNLSERMGRRRFGLKIKCASIARVLSAPSFASKYGDTTEFQSSMSREDSSCDDRDHENGNNNNKIMVVVNSGFEAKCALDWALSHAVQSQDTVLLLHALKHSSQGTESGEKKRHQLVVDMKNMCQMKRPGVKVKVVKVGEGEEQGRAIVEEAKKQRVTLLVIGKRKRSPWWGFVRRWWASNNKRGASANCNGVADYCIQHASCMTVAVRNKNKKLGGYVITTKRHKNFWLLA